MADLQVYATAQDLASWIATEPDNTPALLRSASIRVARACNVSPYDPPTDPAAGPLRDATCAQVTSWIALGVDPAKSGTDLPGPVKSATLLGKKVDRDTAAATKLLETVADGLCQEAEAILLQAGLLYVAVPLGADQSDRLPDWGLGRTWWSPFADPLSGELLYPYGDVGWPSD
jgi:hypothetical protein